jgi:hypothetical protein
MFKGGGGGRVAGHDNQPRPSRHQETANLFAKKAYLGRRSGAVGNMGLIGKIA